MIKRHEQWNDRNDNKTKRSRNNWVNKTISFTLSVQHSNAIVELHIAWGMSHFAVQGIFIDPRNSLGKLSFWQNWIEK